VRGPVRRRNGEITLGTNASKHGSGSAEPEVEEQETVTCFSCGATVPAGAKSCPICHRAVYRTCFCGWEMRADEAICPNCGADWSQSMRVARKKTRSRSSSGVRRKLLRFALIGAVVATGLAGIAWIVISSLAYLGMTEHAPLPNGMGDRMGLALIGIARAARCAGRWAWTHLPLLLTLLGILVAGALGGVLAYFVNARSRHRRSGRSSQVLRRRKRRR